MSEVIRLKTGDNDIGAYRAMRAMLWPMPDDDNRREVAEILKDQDHQAVYLARDESGPLGFLEVRLRDYAEGASTSPVGFLEGWFVIPAARRRHVGRALVEAGENWARSRGCTEMASNTDIENTVSIEAHSHLGYEEIERDVCFLKKLE